MSPDKSIFGVRFQANEHLQPTQEQLEKFLKGPHWDKRRGSHGADLLTYRQLLQDLEAYKPVSTDKGLPPDPRQHLFYGVLRHTRFCNPFLLSAVEQFKYHHDALMGHDFYHAMLFINSSEKEMAKLDKKKISDVVRIARLQEMINERLKLLTTLKKPWLNIVAELLGLTHYVRNNLFRIVTLSERSIAILATRETDHTRESQLIEDVKAYFKEQLKEALRRGRSITQQDLDRAKKEVDAIAKDLRAIIRSDTEALLKTYQAVLDQANKIAWEIDILLSKSGSDTTKSVDETGKLFSNIERSLSKLMGDFRVVHHPTLQTIKPGHEMIVQRKRIDMLDHLFSVLKSDRRAAPERRSNRDRRKAKDPNYRGPERRKNPERRIGKRRRKPGPSQR